MPELFVDTAGWASLADQCEPYYKAASAICRRIRKEGTHLLTTNYIVTELVSLLISPLHFSHNQIVDFILKLHGSSLLQIVHIDSGLHQQSWRLFASRPDKLWSLVDCSSFVVMQERGIAEALTTDHHFEQAGFVRLLK